MSEASNKYESGLQKISIGDGGVYDFSLLSSLSEEASLRYEQVLQSGGSSLTLFQSETNEIQDSITNDTDSSTIQDFVRDTTINGFLIDITKHNPDKVIKEAFSPHQLAVRSGQMTYGEAIARSTSGNGQYYSIYGNEIGATTKFLIGLGIAVEIAGSALEVYNSDTPLDEFGQQSWGIAGGLAVGALGQTVATGLLTGAAAGLGLTVSAPLLIGVGAIGATAGFIAGEEYMEYAYDNLLPEVLDLIVDGVTTVDEITSMAFDAAEEFVDDLWNSTGETAANFFDQIVDGADGLYDDMDQLADDYSWPDSSDLLLEDIPQWLLDLPIFNTPGSTINNGTTGPVSPLVLDIDRSGSIDLVSIENSTATFDFWNTGHAFEMGWVSADDGFLVHDLDQDGEIEGVFEMFGSPYSLNYQFNTGEYDPLNTENGFMALKAHDSNNDGVIDAQDTVWGELQVWQDLNQNGVSETGELFTLDALGIASIDVSNYILDNFHGLNNGGFARINEGHVISHSGSYTATDNTTHEIVDVWFNADVRNSTYNQDYNLDVRALFLPTLRGYGQLSDLHVAASEDNGAGGLLENLETFTTSRTPLEFLNEFDMVRQEVSDLLLEWAGVDLTTSVYEDFGVFGELDGFAFMQKLGGVEAQYMGTWFDGSGYLPFAAEAIPSITQSWDDILDAFTARLIFQTGASTLFEEGVSYNPLTDNFEGTIDLVETMVDALETDATTHTDQQGYWQAVATFIDGVKGLSNLSANETTWLADAVTASTSGTLTWAGIITSLDANIIDGTASTETLNGTTGNDIIESFGGDDVLNGGAGDDILKGYSGLTSYSKTFDGGAGDDVMYGGIGNDTYVYESGHDVIVEVGGNYYGDTDVIELDAGINVSDVSLHIARTDIDFTSHLFLNVEGRGTITIQDDGVPFSPNGQLVDELRFDDGTVVIIDTMDITSHGTNTADYIQTSFLFGDHTYLGYGGDDTINHNRSTDAVIDGGDGNDTINGGGGNDTYIMSAGFDTIAETGGQDVIQLPEGYDFNDIQFLLVDADNVSYQDDIQLIVDGLGTLTVFNSFESPTTAKAVETLRLHDGTTFNLNDIEFTIIGTDGNDLLTDGGAWTSRDNTYVFGQGHDAILDNTDGTDTILFGEGITLEDLTLSRIVQTTGDTPILISGQHLLIEDGQGNSLAVVKQFEYSNDTTQATAHSIEKLEFADGSIVNIADLELDLHGTDSADSITQTPENYSFVDDTIYAYGGNDTVFGWSGNDTVFGGTGNDSINGFDGNDTLNGGADNDTIYGDGGDDTLSGGAGDDILNGGADNDILFGDDGVDYLYGNAGDDVLDGGAGNDNLTANSGNNILIGGAGNDIQYAGTGIDTFSFDNGFGDDYIYFFQQGTDVLDLRQITSVSSIGDLTFTNSGADRLITVGNEGTITLYNYFNATFTENDFLFSSIITGTAASETIYGTAQADTIYGLGGQDYIHGQDGDDTIYGGEGDDFLYGNGGTDTLYGEAGNDLISGHAESDTIDGGDGHDDLFGYESSDLIYGGLGNDKIYGDDQDGFDTYTQGAADEIHGGDGNDIIVAGVGDDLVYGDAGADDLYGNADNDTLYGGLGNDRLYGEAGNDTLNGGDGSDSIYGGSGNDIITGGNGRDYLNGEGGADTFYLDLDNVDRVRDFDQNEGDVINIADLLTGYDAVNDDVNDFVDIVIRSPSRTDIRVDEDGQGGNFQYVGIVYSDLTGETVDSLVASGALVAA